MKKAQIIIEVRVRGLGQSIESHGHDHQLYLHEGWKEIARWNEDLPFDFTLYNEAYFCSCCGEVWARRRWYIWQRIIDGQLVNETPRGWWLNIKPHGSSPFSFYDFPAALKGANPNIWETLVGQFLDDPSICGYTSEAFPRRGPGGVADGGSRERKD